MENVKYSIPRMRYEDMGKYKRMINKAAISDDEARKLTAVIFEEADSLFKSMKQHDWQQKPPLGLKPKWIHDEQRLDEVASAIVRYVEGRKVIPQEWIEEYESLVKTDKRYGKP